MESPATKICSKCGEEKPATTEFFGVSKRDGMATTCKVCCSVRKHSYYLAHKEQAAAASRKWNADNSSRARARRKAYYEAHREEAAAYQRAYREKHKEKHREYARNRHLRVTYGISAKEVDTLLESQGGVCAICGSDSPRNRSWHVDHDHETQRVRGILCGPCNQGLGLFGEELQRFHKSANYLAGGCFNPNVRHDIGDLLRMWNTGYVAACDERGIDGVVSLRSQVEACFSDDVEEWAV